MLDSFRKASKSWVAKGLLGLLVISFGAWGIGDFLTGGGDAPPAITVGDTEVSTAALRSEFNREVNALRQRLGSDFTAEQALQLGFLERAIGRVVTEVVQTQTAQDWGMTVPDEVVARTIVANPAFQGSDGTFDRQRFQAILANNSMTEARFTEQIRSDLVRTALMQPVAGGAHAPESMVAALDRYRNETRVGEVVTLAVADAPEPETAPDEETLQALYDDNRAAFTAPEYRAVTAIVLDLDDARPLVSVSDDAVRAEYEARQSDFTTPESRTVEQVLADDAETARAVVEAVRSGASLADAAAEAGAPAPIDMGKVSPDSLPDAQSDAIFALDEGAVSDPVESAFGWHVFQVQAVTAGTVEAFDTVKGEIREELANHEAVDALYELSVDLDDTLGGGATLEQAADTLNLELVTVPAIDRQGRAPDGTPVAAVPQAPAFLNTVFASDPGEQTLMQESDSGYFVLRVDGVTPSAPRPLEDVRAQVEALWTQQRKAETQRARAEAIVAAASEGRTLSGAAEAEGASAPTRLPAVHRDGTAADDDAKAPPRPLIEALFALDPGASRVVETSDAVHVVRLVDVLDTATDDADTRTETRTALNDALGNDLYIQFTDALSRERGVEINRAVIQSAFQ
ncbi:hypothetical protein F1188_04105 [Roseospira marina]|uniref:Parvulin-like PPIase n=1 Tax=Roseospira marina TaxID=140057 RepID=A0A5M6IFM2_9PROT|nr:SurA N-terminal domain-containing protein [Roseospira marina]KAA5607096.1 hypothetical protein F1188_04105 [Roseospira marina]MBB4312711.1 peptidyl-prolyl cis-trans isomerase D [Roseospira marina]MBB5086516.1 peptidyl-prolyl cis-trans isomerase D [Roseospira marina]